MPSDLGRVWSQRPCDRASCTPNRDGAAPALAQELEQKPTGTPAPSSSASSRAAASLVGFARAHPRRRPSRVRVAGETNMPLGPAQHEDPPRRIAADRRRGCDASSRRRTASARSTTSRRGLCSVHARTSAARPTLADATDNPAPAIWLGRPHRPQPVEPRWASLAVAEGRLSALKARPRHAVRGSRQVGRARRPTLRSRPQEGRHGPRLPDFGSAPTSGGEQSPRSCLVALALFFFFFFAVSPTPVCDLCHDGHDWLWVSPVSPFTSWKRRRNRGSGGWAA